MSSAAKALAFLKRDYQLNVSYRLSFLISLGGIFVSVAVFFFISKLFGRAVNPYLAEYNGDYFSYVLIGIAFSGFATTGISTFSTSISSAQSQGTLEAMLVTPTGLPAIVGLSSLWNYVFNCVNVIIYLAVGHIFFGLSLGRANLPSALVVLILATLAMSGLGVISASFVMLFKRGNPVDSLHGLGSKLLSGMFFPIAVLPAWLQPFAYTLPMFHALRAMRLAVLKGYSIPALAGEIGTLLAFVVVILPFSLWLFKRAVRQAKTDGSLVTY